MPLDRLIFALIVCVVVIIAIAVFTGNGKKDRFMSHQEAQRVHKIIKPLYDQHGANTTYSQFKRALTRGDAVMYHDTRKLYIAGKLTPQAIKEQMDG